ncbi:hypothetical protein TMatcc_010752 [Talaromyces marneffei ATCC 18224]
MCIVAGLPKTPRVVGLTMWILTTSAIIAEIKHVNVIRDAGHKNPYTGFVQGLQINLCSAEESAHPIGNRR